MYNKVKINKFSCCALALAAALSLSACGEQNSAKEQTQTAAPAYAAGTPEAVAVSYIHSMLSGDYDAFIKNLRPEKQIDASKLEEARGKLDEMFRPYLEVLKRDTQSCGGIEGITVAKVSYPEGKSDEAVVQLKVDFKDRSKKPHEDQVRLEHIEGEWIPSLRQ